MARKPWAGAFARRTHPAVERFTASVETDRRLAPYDLLGTIAHVETLARARLLKPAEAKRLVRELRRIGREIDAGRFRWDPALEDVHMNVEAALRRRLGDLGAKVHAGRSRNDQVATAARLWAKHAAGRLVGAVRDLQRSLVARAEAHPDAIMPGYTHLQQAQPVLFAHWCLAHVEALGRDVARLAGAFSTADECPLGAAALAGTSLPLDRTFSARRLHFSAPCRNSIDAVSARDFLLEFLAATAILMVHLSRLAEEIVIWSSSEFGFVRLDDSVATGSSIMPQKKNPDVAELVRGKAGAAIGRLAGLLATAKGLPLAYNRDLQEDKAPCFAAFDDAWGALHVLTVAVETLAVDEDRMEAAIDAACLATDLADHLVARGVPFRRAHEVVGRLVGACATAGGPLTDLTEDELRVHHPGLAGAARRLDARAAVEARRTLGGTAPGEVRRQIRLWKTSLRRGRL